MKLLLTAYFTTLAAFFGIDFPWLSTMGERFYRPILKDGWPILKDGWPTDFGPPLRSGSSSPMRRVWCI